MKIKVIIVDDEIHARGFLRKFCERYFSELIYVMDECNSVESAVRSIKKYQPDLVFLDIQMPEENGFELLGKCFVQRYCTFTNTESFWYLKMSLATYEKINNAIGTRIICNKDYVNVVKNQFDVFIK